MELLTQRFDFRFDNMFVGRSIPLETKPQEGRKRKLVLRFASPMKEARKEMKRCGGQRVTWNGHYERNFVRKAQYHYVSDSLYKETVERLIAVGMGLGAIARYFWTVASRHTRLFHCRDCKYTAHTASQPR